MKKKVWIIVIIICLLLIIGVNYYFLWLYPIDFKNVSYTLVDKKVKALLTFSNNVTEGSCYIDNLEYPLNDHQCEVIMSNEKTDIHVKTKFNQVVVTLDPKQDQVLDFSLTKDKEDQVKAKRIIERIKYLTDDIELLGNNYREEKINEKN